jgi:hypothetical protein
MQRSLTLGARVGTVLISVAAFAACGGDDTAAPASSVSATLATDASVGEAPATDATTSAAPTAAATAATDPAATEPAGAAPDATEFAPDDTILIDSLDEMPAECIDLFTQELQTLEPKVSGIDWDQASYGDFFGLLEELDPVMSPLDEAMTEQGCDTYQPADDAQTFAILVPLAQEVAPGVIPWLNSFDSVFASFDAEPDTAPEACAAAVTLVQGLIDDGKSMSDTLIRDLAEVGGAVSSVQACSTADAQALAQDDAFFVFLSGNATES